MSTTSMVPTNSAPAVRLELLDRTHNVVKTIDYAAHELAYCDRVIRFWSDPQLGLYCLIGVAPQEDQLALRDFGATAQEPVH